MHTKSIHILLNTKKKTLDRAIPCLPQIMLLNDSSTLNSFVLRRRVLFTGLPAKKSGYGMGTSSWTRWVTMFVCSFVCFVLSNIVKTGDRNVVTTCLRYLRDCMQVFNYGVLCSLLWMHPFWFVLCPCTITKLNR